MGKSLTEIARQVLTEGSYPSVSPDQNGKFDRDAKSTTTAKSSLKVGAGYKEGTFSNPGATAPTGSPSVTVEQPKKPGEGDNVGAKVATKGKDTSVKGSTSAGDKAAFSNSGAKKPTEMMEEDESLDEEEQIDEVSKNLVHNAIQTAFDRSAAYSGEDNEKAEKYAKKGFKLTKAQKRKNVRQGKDENDGFKKSMKEDLEEEFELSEELTAFIDEMVAEGYSEDEIAAAIDENFEIVSEDAEMIEEEAEEEYQVDMSEHVDALLAGEDLSEEFREKAKTIFEAAVKQKVEAEIARLEEAYAEVLEEEVETIKNSLTENVDDYLNYVVEQWVEDNEVAIESGLRTELTEEFISGLRQLFAENYIDIPEDKVSVVEEMASKVEELEEKLNEEIERNVSLNKMINESKQVEVIFNACDGLTDTQAEKLKSLAEGLEFTTVEEYASKINILKENYFSNNVVNENVLDNNDVSNEGGNMISEELSGPMAKYVRALGRSLPK